MEVNIKKKSERYQPTEAIPQNPGAVDPLRRTSSQHTTDIQDGIENEGKKKQLPRS